MVEHSNGRKHQQIQLQQLILQNIQPLQAPPQQQCTTCIPITNEFKKKSGGKRGVRRRCCFAGCSTTDRDKDYISLSAVKSKPKKDFNDMIDAKVDSVKRVMHNYYLRYYTLDRCGQRDEGEQYYLCNNHEMETKVV